MVFNRWVILRNAMFFCLVIAGIMAFNSYGHVLYFNLHTYKPHGFMQNFWEMWKPSFAVSSIYWEGFNYIQMPFYVFAMFWFIRKAKIFSYEFILFATMALTYSIIHGNARYREPFIMVLFLWIGKQFKGGNQ